VENGLKIGVFPPQFSSIPPHYDGVYLEMARRGARVLVLGYRKLGAWCHTSRSVHQTLNKNFLFFTLFLFTSQQKTVTQSQSPKAVDA